MKKSFVLHYDSLDVLEAMTDEQCWKLLKKMRSYHNGNDYVSGDQLVDVVFIPLKNQFDRDNEKREQEKEKRVEAWRLWGKATQSKFKQDQANQASAWSAKANQAVNVNVSGNVSINENDKKKIFTPPSLEDVKSYFKENWYKEDVANRAYNHYNIANRHDANWKKVINRKQKMQSVWFKDENKLALSKMQKIDREYEKTRPLWFTS